MKSVQKKEKSREFLSLFLCVSFWVLKESRGMGSTRWVWRNRCACSVLYSKLTVTFFKKETMSFGGVLRSMQLSSSVTSVSLCLFMFFF